MSAGSPIYLGEFEQIVLLAIMRLGGDANGVSIGRELEAQARRAVSRSSLYTTLDRLEQKQLVRWKVALGGEERGRLPRRVYTLTARGLASIRAAQRVFRRMTVGLEDLLEDPGT
jgi:DNA-binding PadR family transcriptional regulator